jgi:hypothetical protein
MHLDWQFADSRSPAETVPMTEPITTPPLLEGGPNWHELLLSVFFLPDLAAPT